MAKLADSEAFRFVRAGYLTIRVTRAAGLAMIVLDGELDVSTVRDAYMELEALEAGEATRITVDLAELEFVDSQGLAFLASAARRSSANGERLRFTRPESTAVEKLLVISGVDGVLYDAG